LLYLELEETHTSDHDFSLTLLDIGRFFQVFDEFFADRDESASMFSFIKHQFVVFGLT